MLQPLGGDGGPFVQAHSHMDPAKGDEITLAFSQQTSRLSWQPGCYSYYECWEGGWGAEWCTISLNTILKKQKIVII